MRGDVRTWISGAALAATGLALLGAGSPSARAADPGVLSVAGAGEVSHAPDVAYLRLGVQLEAEQAGEAQRQVSEAAAKILQALSKLGVEQRDVQTAELQIGPRYSSGSASGEPELNGYVASNVVNVTVRKLEQLGTLVDAGLAAGANRVDSIQYALLDDTKARAEALRLAVLDARAKGRTLSEALEVRLGAVRALRESATAVPSPGGPMYRMMGAESVGTPTSAGEIRVRGEVLLEYAIQ